MDHHLLKMLNDSQLSSGQSPNSTFWFSNLFIIFFNLIFFLLLILLSSQYLLCNISCSGSASCVLPFPFPCLSKPIQKCLPFARHCSNLWCYSNEQNRRQSLCFLRADIGGGRRRSTVNKCQVVMSAMKGITLDKEIEWCGRWLLYKVVRESFCLCVSGTMQLSK